MSEKKIKFNSRTMKMSSVKFLKQMNNKKISGIIRLIDWWNRAIVECNIIKLYLRLN